MAETKFQYVRSVTGSLSGASMAQQTEDALTSISHTAENARQIVVDAQSNIESALTAAQVAQAQSETNLKEMRLIAQELSGLNIPDQDGQMGKFVGTNGTKLVWQKGMRYMGEVETKSDLPITPTLTHGTLVGGDLPDTTLDELKKITNGGFNITVEGDLKEYAGLNFSICSSLSDAVAIINSAIKSWGSCAYQETPIKIEVKTNLYPWLTQDGSQRIYAQDLSLTAESKLYNADGSLYTGTAFKITAVVSDDEEETTYKVTYNGADCYLSPSAVITLISYEDDTLRQYVLTTTKTGTTATIGLALSPSLQTTQDVSTILQLSSGTATNGASIGNVESDVYFVTGEQAVYFWDGSEWKNISAKTPFTTVITLTKDTASGTAITIPTRTYIVGANNLAVNWNGVKCYKDKNFSEIGNSGASSSTFKLLFDAKNGDEIEITIY